MRSENARKINRSLIIVVICVFTVGGFLGGYAAGRGRSSADVTELNRRYDTLNREYAERQRVITNGIDEAIGIAENARAITERTGENSGRAIGNLTEAVRLIGQGIEERKNLEMELDNLRSSLYRLRDLAWVENSALD